LAAVAIIAVESHNFISALRPLKKVVLSEEAHCEPLHWHYAETALVQINRVKMGNEGPWSVQVL